jgi:hypothetical protein
MESNTRNKGDGFHGVPRNQFTMAGFDVCESAETVDLQFKDELVGIGRLDTAGEPYRTQVSRGHEQIIRREFTKRSNSYGDVEDYDDSLVEESAAGAHLGAVCQPH